MKRSFDKLMEWDFTPTIVFGVSFLLTNNPEVSLVVAMIFALLFFLYGSWKKRRRSND
jgi:uncharacterized membrane protein